LALASAISSAAFFAASGGRTRTSSGVPMTFATGAKSAMKL
jgi:hypothetical protein